MKAIAGIKMFLSYEWLQNQPCTKISLHNFWFKSYYFVPLNTFFNVWHFGNYLLVVQIAPIFCFVLFSKVPLCHQCFFLPLFSIGSTTLLQQREALIIMRHGTPLSGAVYHWSNGYLSIHIPLSSVLDSYFPLFSPFLLFWGKREGIKSGWRNEAIRAKLPRWYLTSLPHPCPLTFLWLWKEGRRKQLKEDYWYVLNQASIRGVNQKGFRK